MTKRKKMPLVEADPSPILAPHLTEQRNIPEFVGKEATKNKSPAPKKQKTKEQILEEKFDTAVKEIIKLESRPEWREMIKETKCFAYLWRDPETEEFCTELECDLRRLCQLTWERVEGGLPPLEPVPRLWGSEKRKKVGRKRDSSGRIIKRAKWKHTTKYNRQPYQDRGRPIDKIAMQLFCLLGKPQELPDPWKYPEKKKKGKIVDQAKEFIEQHGPGVRIAKRSSYHQYLFQGRHLMRLWVDANGGGWLDCSKSLAHFLSKGGKIDLEKPPESGYKTKYRYYPFRVYLSRDRDVEKIKTALHLIEDLVE